MASSSAQSVRDAAIKTGEACATKLQEGLTMTARTLETCALPLPQPCVRLSHAAPPPRRRVMDQAGEINKDRTELGEEVTRKLLAKCQENVRALCQVEAQQQANRSSLAGLRTELPEEVVPADLQRIFAESLKKHTEAHTGRSDVEQRREMVKLRALMTGEAADDAMEEGGDGACVVHARQTCTHAHAGSCPRERCTRAGDDEVQMTQQTITNVKCPILQMPMQTKGDMRPMTPRRPRTTEP